MCWTHCSILLVKFNEQYLIAEQEFPNVVCCYVVLHSLFIGAQQGVMDWIHKLEARIMHMVTQNCLIDTVK